MDFIGVVCEYNPFHNGHEYHLRESARQTGGLPVVCVMSGDFVQRGEAALYAKHARAEAAVRGGADVVFELPLPWALASAESFARGAVGLLGALGAGMRPIWYCPGGDGEAPLGVTRIATLEALPALIASF